MILFFLINDKNRGFIADDCVAQSSDGLDLDDAAILALGGSTTAALDSRLRMGKTNFCGSLRDPARFIIREIQGNVDNFLPDESKPKNSCS